MKDKEKTALREKVTEICKEHYWDEGDAESIEALVNFIIEEKKVTGKTSDGYHTFDELYEFRMLYNAALFNEWGKNKTVPVVKSKRHADDQLCFGGGWFIVVAELPSGQISNHYELKNWDLFKITEHDKVPWAYDDHTPQDVAERLRAYLEGRSDMT